jgi:hypothetical protein
VNGEEIEFQAAPFAIVPEWVYDRLEDDPQALRFYNYLAVKVINCRTRQGFRKIEDMAAHFKTTPRSVKRWLAACVEAGTILAKQTRRRDGNWGRNVYLLPRDNPAVVAEFTGGHEVSPDGGTPSVPSGIKTQQELDLQKTPSSVEVRARAHRLPEDFAVTEDMKTWARENVPNIGWSEHEKFMDHFLSISGPNSRKVDWVRAWRNWMRRANEQQFHRPSPQFKTAHEKRQETAKSTGDLIEEAIALVESRGGSEDDGRAVYRAMQEVKAQRAAGASMTTAYRAQQLELPS